jgi:acyl carrier protein
VSLELANKSIKELSSDEIASYLQALWKMQLKIDNVSMQDDFMSIGGQSIDMFRMLARLEEDFDLEIDFDDFFEDTHLSSLHTLLVKLA